MPLNAVMRRGHMAATSRFLLIGKIMFGLKAKTVVIDSAVLASLAIASAQASAAAVDVAAVVTDIGAQAAPIGLIGSAVLLIFLAVKAFHWIRKALA